MKKTFCHNFKDGFTLLEVILAVTILMIISGAIVSFMYNSYFTATNEMKKAELNNEAKGVTDKIIDKMRQTDGNNIKLYSETLSEITTVYDAATNPDAQGKIILIGDTWYRLDTSGSLVTFSQTNSSDGSLPDAAYCYSLITSNGKSIDDFNIRIIEEQDNPTSRYRKYEINLKLTQGMGEKANKATVTTTFVKYMRPN